MGGAPGIYLNKWHEIISFLNDDDIFHSDLLLVERIYKREWLISLRNRNVLVAVNIKGVTSEDFEKNTNRGFNKNLFWYNFDLIVKTGVNFYLTFTNPDSYYIDGFKRKIVDRYGEEVLEDSFIIDLIDYGALKE